MLLLIISGLVALVSGVYAFSLPKAYKHLEESSRFMIGFEKGAGLLNKYVRQSYPILMYGSKIIFAVSLISFVYLSFMKYGVT